MPLSPASWGNPFVARARELEALKDAFASSRAGGGKLVVLTGEGGIGQSRFVEHYTSWLCPDGAATLWWSCNEDPDVAAYWQWLRIIEAHAERRDDAALLGELGAGAADIVPLVPKLSARLPQFARPTALDPPEARLRLFDGLRTFLRNAARACPLVIVLDDLHWADDASLAFLEHLARDVSELNVLLVLAYRDLDLVDGSQVASRIGTIVRYGKRLPLAGLDEPEVGTLMEGICGRAPPKRLVAEVHDRTSGNPFFVDQMSRWIGSQGSWDHVDLDRLHIPTEVRAVVRGRLVRLTEAAREVLSIAAVIGRTFELDVLCGVTEKSTDALLGLLHAPMLARIVEKAPDAPREYGFTHALIRETLYDDLPPLDRARTHERTARAVLAAH